MSDSHLRPEHLWILEIPPRCESIFKHLRKLGPAVWAADRVSRLLDSSHKLSLQRAASKIARLANSATAAGSQEAGLPAILDLQLYYTVRLFSLE